MYNINAIKCFHLCAEKKVLKPTGIFKHLQSLHPHSSRWWTVHMFKLCHSAIKSFRWVIPYDITAKKDMMGRSKLNHSMVMEATSLVWGCCWSSSNTSGELTSVSSNLVSSVMTAVSSEPILREVEASRGSGERKLEELSQFWVEEETWEMTDIWTEEEDEAAVVVAVAVLPGKSGWCWDSSSSYWTPSASSSSWTWLR